MNRGRTARTCSRSKDVEDVLFSEADDSPVGAATLSVDLRRILVLA